MNASNNKTKTMWSIINNITKPNKTKQKQKNISLKLNNTELKSPQQVSTAFNHYFASVGTDNKSAAALDPAVHSVHTPAINSMYLEPVTEREVYNIIRGMQNKRSFGVDDIPPLLVKTCVKELVSPLTKLINISFIEGRFPEKLKIAKIRPIAKTRGSTENPCDYRPIALLPTFSKIFEKAMAIRVNKFLEKYNILNKNQFGFRKKCSTTLAVYNYLQAVYSCINERKYAIGLFLDMTKAYDKVSHKILLQKIYGSGIRGQAFNWFKSYLKDRMQFVEVEYFDSAKCETYNIRSDMTTINASIPQGSVVGCTLFLLYVNDLPKHINSSCILFADDVSLLFKTPANVNHLAIQKTFTDTEQWLNDHNLEINLSKTKICQFRTYQRPPLNLNILTQHLNLEEVNEFTLLGITLDSNLNWKKHIECTSAKLSQFIYALSVLKRNTDYKTALSAYYAYAYSWLNYGIILWGESTDFPDLFIQQKKCLRILMNIDQRESCRPHFIKQRILTLPAIYILQGCIFVRKNRHLFKSNDEVYANYNRRNKNRLVLPLTTLKLIGKSPYSRLVNIYNKLPEKFKSLTKDSLFCKQLKSLLIEKAYYTVDEFKADKL